MKRSKKQKREETVEHQQWRNRQKSVINHYGTTHAKYKIRNGKQDDSKSDFIDQITAGMTSKRSPTGRLLQAT